MSFLGVGIGLNKMQLSTLIHLLDFDFVAVGLDGVMVVNGWSNAQ